MQNPPYPFQHIVILFFTGKPDRPGKLTVSDIDITKMTLCWYPPDVDGGTPITGYIVEDKEVSSSQWCKVNLDVALGTTLEITGLKMNSEYHFRVAAKNMIGVGPYSDTLGPYTTLGKNKG